MVPEAIILAGGMGTRLKSVVSDVPKPMAPVAGRPFLTYLLDQIANTGIQNVYLSVGYKHEVILQYFGRRYKHLNLHYVIEKERLGTGGGIRLAAELATSNTLFVLNGDTYFDVAFPKFFDHHQHAENGMTIALKQMSNVTRYGMVKQDGQRIIGFSEKSAEPVTGNINGGIYCLNRTLFLEKTKPTAFSMETDFMEKYVNDIAIGGFESEGYFIDIGIPEDYTKANQYFEQF
ncbi:MAG: nucleotidyltransferase family protein [Bacteroidia bacterium]|nr:nucleotidyltransferase family protein [Bacteroidia bacterium]